MHTLNLERCEALTGFPAEIGQCASLHTLKLEGCDNLRELPASLANTPYMQNDDILHSRVEEPLFAAPLAGLIKIKPSLAHHADEQGRRAIDHAHPECMRAMRSALLFYGRYDLGASSDALAHVSRTCAVAFARDMTDAVKAGDPGDDVALKFMSDRLAFEREVSFREHLDPKHVMGIKCTHGISGDDDGGGEGDDDFADELRELVGKDTRFQRDRRSSDDDDEDSNEGKNINGNIKANNHNDVGPGAARMKRNMSKLPSMAGGRRAPHETRQEYAYCIVMPRADRTLAEAVQHEHFAGEDWAKIRVVAAHLAEALAEALHASRLIHGDVKPLNAVRYDGRWRLIDLDCACEIGQAFGAKQPSTGYAPPEMARVVRDALRDGAVPGAGDINPHTPKLTPPSFHSTRHSFKPLSPPMSEPYKALKHVHI